MTRSRNAGSGSVIEVFNRTHIDPIGAVFISFHLCICFVGGSSRQEQAMPFAFRSCIFSCGHLQI